ncbi:hypothetical protein L1049_007847 [Liquidambar formosana]|uniref:Uncharacterized protein n=1 Tax=Liquidambar formosana TaxID=63359 RepID=A0AAP0X1W3_LIQFO
MAYCGSYYNEYIFRDYDPALYDACDGIAGTYEGLLPSLGAIFYPRPTLDPNSPPQEELPHEKEEADFTNRGQNENGLTEGTHGGEQLHYTGWENWPSEYDFCSGGCWGEDFVSHGHGTCDNRYGSGLEKTDYFYQTEEQLDSFYSYYEGMDEQAGCDHNTWSGLGYEYGYEEDSWDYGRQEPKPTYGYSQDALGLCESVFGYWPCLFREDQKSYGDEAANKQIYGQTWNWTMD